MIASNSLHLLVSPTKSIVPHVIIHLKKKTTRHNSNNLKSLFSIIRTRRLRDLNSTNENWEVSELINE